MRVLLKETKYKKGSEKLSIKDKKLIQLLIQDSRLSITQLSKKVGISKPAIIQKIKSLKKKGILLNSLLSTNLNALDETMYVFEISTQLGMTTEEINEKLLKIKEILAVLWYNGVYNLTLAISTKDPGEVIDKIEEITNIKKFRISRIRDHWMHPPYLFKEVKDKKIEFSRVEARADKTDKKIINYLYDNPNANFSELSENTNLAPQTVKKRLKELEENGTILGFIMFVNPWLCGREVVSMSLIVKGKKETEKLIKHLLKLPQTSDVWELDNEWNINVVFWVKEQIEINEIMNKIYDNFNVMDVNISVLVAVVGK